MVSGVCFVCKVFHFLLLLRNTMKKLVSINKVNYKSDKTTTQSYTLSITEKVNGLIKLSSVCYLTLVVRLSAEKYHRFCMYIRSMYVWIRLHLSR
jgi:hypothetical protein